MELREVFKAKNLNEVLELLDQYKERGKIIAGGTDIVIDLRHGRISPEALIDISSVDELAFIKEVDEYIEIGAATTFTTIANSQDLNDRLNGLKEAARSVGSPQIRNRGTIGGNICNGSPAADTVPPLLALGSKAIIRSNDGEREVSLDEFFLDKGKVDLKDNEILFSLKFKNPTSNQGVSFSKLGLRKALAISRICTSVYAHLDEDGKCKEIRIANGSLGKYALREREVENFFIGKDMNSEKAIEEGINLLNEEVSKRLAGRSTVEFKSEAVKGTFRKAITEALDACKK